MNHKRSPASAAGCTEKAHVDGNGNLDVRILAESASGARLPKRPWCFRAPDHGPGKSIQQGPFGGAANAGSVRDELSVAPCYALLFGAVPSDENFSTIKKTAVPFLIAVRDKRTHGELTGVVVDVLAFDLSINMTSALEYTLRCGNVSHRLPSSDLHSRCRSTLVTFESLIRGPAF